MNPRDAVLGAPQQFEPIEVFGGKYTVRFITGAERDAIKLWQKNNPPPDSFGFRELLVAIFLGDENGARIFKDSDMEILKSANCVDMERIGMVGLRLNRMIGDDEKKT